MIDLAVPLRCRFGHRWRWWIEDDVCVRCTRCLRIGSVEDAPPGPAIPTLASNTTYYSADDGVDQ
jgi:hypothetical protein